MAKDDELELDTAKPKGGGKGKLIIIIVAVVLLTTGSVIWALYFMGVLGGGDKDSAESKEGEKDALKELVIKPAFYMDMQPAFVVNFEDQTHAAYLQIEMQLMARDKLIFDTVNKHMPLIRNNVLLILSAQKFEEVKTREGKEKLQKTLLEAIQKVVSEASQAEAAKQEKKEEGKEKAPSNIEQVYFTSFIMQ